MTQDAAAGERLRRYAELAVRTGANVGEGQDVMVTAELAHAPLAREVAAAAYRAGARYVNVRWWDPQLKRARLLHAGEQTLADIPDWWDAPVRHVIERRGAFVSLAGESEPDVFDGVEPGRLARDRMPWSPSIPLLMDSGAVNWTVVACPNEGWARRVFGEPDLERLWRLVAEATRLDAADPVAAWRAHLDALARRAAALDAAGLEAVRLRGPGTDLRVGLVRGARWLAAEFETAWGRRHVSNLPTEEVFTTPDFRSVEGRVRATTPLVLGGVVVEDLELRFRDGVAVDVRASAGEEAIRAELGRDDGAARLGELALVDGSSAVGRTGVLFHETLFDENAACHIALGAAYAEPVPDLPEGAEARAALGYNESSVHVDVMVGGAEVEVLGLRAGGGELLLIAGDRWQI